MATASHKFHSSGDIGVDRSRKRKEYSRSASRDRVSRTKSKKKDKHKERDRREKKERDRGEKKENERLKVRSISELAELVKSGQVQVPKSLVHYQQDKVQLLDQVFTILSPKDVKDMVPDTLKDLKMKQVKDICYEQLKTLSDEQITEAIASSSSMDISARLNDLIGNIESNQTGKQQDSSGGEAKDDTMEDVSDKSKQETVPTEEEDDEIVINVSDVSEGSGISDNETRDGGCGCAPPKSGSSVSEVSATPPLSTPVSSVKHKEVTDGGKQNLAAIDKTESDSDKNDTRRGPGDSVPTLDEDSKTGEPPVQGVQVGADEFLEMDLRRRALEAELRRTNTDRFPGSRQRHGRATSEASGSSREREEGKDGGKSFEESEDLIMLHPEIECRDSDEEGQEKGSGDSVEEGRGDRGDQDGKVGELLEEKLRERALQAMFTRKGHSLKRHSTS